MVALVVKFDVKPERRADFLAVMDVLVPASQNETGCIQYELFNDVKDINEFVLFEKWQDQPALDFHNQTKHFEECGPQLGDICADVTIETYGPIR